MNEAHLLFVRIGAAAFASKLIRLHTSVDIKTEP